MRWDEDFDRRWYAEHPTPKWDRAMAWLSMAADKAFGFHYSWRYDRWRRQWMAYTDGSEVGDFASCCFWLAVAAFGVVIISFVWLAYNGGRPL